MHHFDTPSIFLPAASNGLLTKTKFFNNSTVSFDITALQVVQQRTTLTYQSCQSSFSAIIFSVELQVLSQVRNTV